MICSLWDGQSHENAIANAKGVLQWLKTYLAASSRTKHDKELLIVYFTSRSLFSDNAMEG